MFEGLSEQSFKDTGKVGLWVVGFGGKGFINFSSWGPEIKRLLFKAPHTTMASWIP